MTKAEREEFRVYCEQCTDDQLREVLAKEQKAADAEGNVGFRSVCAAIAEGVALARGIAIVALCAVLAAGCALVHDAPYAGEPVEAAEASRGAPPTEEKAA